MIYEKREACGAEPARRDDTWKLALLSSEAMVMTNWRSEVGLLAVGGEMSALPLYPCANAGLVY